MSNEEMLQNLKEEARAHTMFQNHGEAIKRYKQILLLTPDDFKVKRNLALAYLFSKQDDEALTICKTIMESGAKVNKAEVFELKGIAYESKGNDEKEKRHAKEATVNYDQAISQYKEAMKLSDQFYYLYDQIEAIEFKKIDACFDMQLYECVEAVLKSVFVAPTEQRDIYHYTSLNVGKKLLIENSPFQLSDISNANDPSEGRLLWEHFELEEERTSDQDVEEITPQEKPVFIACFSKEGNALDMWRTYGKEEGKEAAGCAIKFGHSYFASRIPPLTILSEGALIDALDPEKLKNDDQINHLRPQIPLLKNEEKKELPPIYHVIYLQKNNKKLALSEKSKSQHKKLDLAWKKLNGEVGKFKKSEKYDPAILRRMLSRLRHLVKSDHYESEEEMRLVIDYLPLNHPAIQLDLSASKARTFIAFNLEEAIKSVVLGHCVAHPEALAMALKVAQAKRGNPDFSVHFSTIAFR